jgi:DNA primase
MDIISEIRDRSSIVEVISEFTALKKQGKNYRGSCPFPDRRYKSHRFGDFMVSEEKQIYHCFTCSRGGDVILFLLKIKKYTIANAVRELANRLGIDIPSTNRRLLKLIRQSQSYE